MTNKRPLRCRLGLHQWEPWEPDILAAILEQRPATRVTRSRLCALCDHAQLRTIERMVRQ